MCPSADGLLAFVAGELAPDASSGLEAHMDECSACRSAVSNIVRGTVPEPRFGRYEIETVLGDGGMGIVYRAYDPKLARAVAIKVVKTSGDDESLRERLVREAQSLARLSHPNVCHVYDVGREHDEVWVAMELIDGVDLRLWAATHGAAEVESALVSAARGIAAAHMAGLIHRDVKPENVLVARDGRTVVTDFGLARGSDATITSLSAAGGVSGTPAYLAPEQLTASPLDARVDQFAWAVMAWELLAGERPFPVEPVARLAAIRLGVPRPRHLDRRVADPLRRALSSAPRERFESMDALVQAFGRPAGRRAWRRLAALAGVVFATVVAVVAAVTAEDGSVAAGAAPIPTGSAAVAARPASAAVQPAPTGALAGAPAAASPSLGKPAPPDPDAAIKPPPVIAREAAASGRPGAATVRGPKQPATAGLGVAATPPKQRVRGELPGASPPPLDGAPAASSTEPGPASPPAPDRPAVSAGIPVDPYVRDPSPRVSFDRSHAERILADCRFPVDPARPGGPLVESGRGVVDWGPITRRQEVRTADGMHETVLYEVQGNRDRYLVDSAGMTGLGILDAAVGELLVVCPFSRPVAGSPGTTTSSIYAFAPAAVVPRIATDLRALDPVHVPEATLRALTPGIVQVLVGRALLVLARPVKLSETSWEMNGWTLEVSDLALVDARPAEGRALWLVVDRLRLEGAPGSHRPVLHGVRALGSLLR